MQVFSDIIKSEMEGVTSTVPFLTNSNNRGIKMAEKILSDNQSTIKNCVIKGCKFKHDAKGMCSTHYGRWRKHGNPYTVKRRGAERKPVIQGVYAVVNILSGQQYVGSTSNYVRRKNQHLSRLRKGTHYSPKLQREFTELGETAFEVILLEIVRNGQSLITCEQKWLDKTESKYNASSNATNKGIEFPKGWHHTEEAKRKISEKSWTKLRGYSDKQRKALSEAQKKLYANGYKSPVAKPVIQMTLDGEFIKEWESVTQAARDLGGHDSLIIKCLKGNRTKTLGYTWRYK
jgi:group I intron endonuclease